MNANNQAAKILVFMALTNLASITTFAKDQEVTGSLSAELAP